MKTQRKATVKKSKNSSSNTFGCTDLIQAFRNNLRFRMVKEENTATLYDRYLALAYELRDRLVENWLLTQRTYQQKKVKRVYYLSLEYLMGRMLGNTMINLKLEGPVQEAINELGYSLEDLREAEPDAGLGNGGLGRLAACFLDSMATLGIPSLGYGIRYDYGIFRQKILKGCQVEEPDEWLARENPWEVARPEYTYRIRFGGKVVSRRNRTGRLVFDWVDTDDVLAMAYDTPVPGYGNRTVNNLRLWSAKATEEFDLEYFNQGDYIAATSKKTASETISKVLYPNDNSPAGRELRLKQQYFLVSASLQDILRRFKREHSDWRELPEAAAVQMNDTHPALAVPEMMRLLVDEEHQDWDLAWEITTQIMAYTNHTLLPEALEKWSRSIIARLFPRHLQIIEEINHRFLRQVANRFPGDRQRLQRMSIFEEGSDPQIRMAYLAIVGSHSVNGVSALHTDILKSQVVPDFYEFWPEKFNNKTNGITQRRWLLKCNPELARCVTDHIGEGWILDLMQLKKLETLSEDAAFLEKLKDIKRKNKEKLSRYIAKEMRVLVPTDALFDVQIKRIHEYKRQLLNALHVIWLYLRLKEDPNVSWTPRAVLFGGKAAPGYWMAKLIIQFINAIANVVNHDPQVRGKLTCLFLPDYRVSLAEKIIPASDLSEQISTAGKEASGTGNMKFALNGALTIGTLDGANIEIREAVGPENFFLFGMTAEEVQRLWREGYRPRTFYERSPRLKRVLDLVASGFFSPENADLFQPIVKHLLEVDTWCVLADFDAYVDCQETVSEAYRDSRKWFVMTVKNIANMGRFSSDRTIQEYAEHIWKAKSIIV